MMLKVHVSKNKTFKVVINVLEQKFCSAEVERIMWKWHKSFGHLNFKSLNQLQKNEMVKGFPSILFPSQVSGGYCEAKQLRKSYKSIILTRDCMKLHIIHMKLKT